MNPVYRCREGEKENAAKDAMPPLTSEEASRTLLRQSA